MKSDFFFISKDKYINQHLNNMVIVFKIIEGCVYQTENKNVFYMKLIFTQLTMIFVI